MEPGMLHDLITNGIIDGTGSVLVFLPNILILFFFISLMEDSGYMARAAFIMDKIMHFFGLHGRSFVPMIMGFGCNVPAIMATRTIRNPGDRLLTMMIVPFMSCSARLPVYVLFYFSLFPNLSGTHAGSYIFHRDYSSTTSCSIGLIKPFFVIKKLLLFWNFHPTGFLLSGMF